jgi:hypothetical protein
VLVPTRKATSPVAAVSAQSARAERPKSVMDDLVNQLAKLEGADGTSG